MVKHVFIAHIVLFALISGCSSFAAQENSITIDLSKPAPNPIYKSKLGFARAASFKELPGSIDGLSVISPRVFCSELDFDDVEDPNYALEPDPFSFGSNKLVANPWMRSLDEKLVNMGIEPYYQIIGAPKPYQQKVIKRPAIHPVPTDIQRSAELTARWISANFPNAIGRSWLLWNEPSHTLRGSPTMYAAKDMADIFHAYAQEIRKVDKYAQIGYASFIAHALKNVPPRSDVSFLDRVFEFTDKVSPLSESVDFITLNNYYGKTYELLDQTESLLKKYGSNAAIILSQYAPPGVADKDSEKNTVESALSYIENYDKFVRNKSVKNVCFSYWTGATDKAFYRYSPKSKKFDHQLNFHALNLYQQLGTWRADATYPPGSPLATTPVVASFDHDKVAVLLVNRSATAASVSVNFIGAKVKPKLTRITYATREGAQSQDLPYGDFTRDLKVTLRPESVTLVTIDTENVSKLSKNTDVFKRNYVNSRSMVYRSAINSNEGSGFYDNQDHRFIGETIRTSDISHSAGLFKTLPRSFKLVLSAPSSAGLDEFLKCWSFHITSKDRVSPSLHAKYRSNLTTLKEIEAGPVDIATDGVFVPIELQKLDSSAVATISGLEGKGGPLELHSLMLNCKSPVQASIQLSQ